MRALPFPLRAVRPASFSLVFIATAVLALSGCKDDDAPAEEVFVPLADVDYPNQPDLKPPPRGLPTVTAERLFPTDDNPGETWAGCLYASPIEHGGRVVVVESGGTVAKLDPQTGKADWKVALPTGAGEDPVLIASPAVVGDRLIATYWTAHSPEGRESGSFGHSVNDQRLRHHVAVVDLATGTVDSAFAPISLEASMPAATEGETVTFRPDHSLSRSTVTHAVPPGSTLGRVYISFGNARDIQPWHGWMFEVDLDVWLAEGADTAVTAVFVTTPEHDCGPTGASGSSQRICGGGLWAPSGPLVLPDGAGSYEIIVAPGNGQLDLARKDYANTLMRLPPGLDFDPGCDAVACADFNPDDPTAACMESCPNLFIPRALPEQPALSPSDGSCDGLTRFECWERLDYIGGSTPTLVEVPGGPSVLAYPAKDGHVYLVDALDFGVLHDRYQAAVLCGTTDDPCRWPWAGMIVTQPELVWLDERPILLVPTFMPDKTHAAGVVALEVAMEGGVPKLKPFWRWPTTDSAESVERFRRHPSRTRIEPLPSGEEVAWIVETRRGGETGKLLGLHAASGTLLVEADMVGPGQRFSQPLLIGDKLYVNSCDSDEGESRLVGFAVSEGAGE